MLDTHVFIQCRNWNLKILFPCIFLSEQPERDSDRIFRNSKRNSTKTRQITNVYPAKGIT